MDKGRRDFLKTAGLSALLVGTTGKGSEALAESSHSRTALEGPRLAMVIDTRLCARKEGCKACSEACHLVHNVPRIPDPDEEVKWIWKEAFQDALPGQVMTYPEKELMERPVPVLCNHCDDPPCVRVCPTQATWKREDGAVMMDMHRCIGCRYCMVACPYGSRSFNFSNPRRYLKSIDPGFPTRMKGVVEKCNFCTERLAQGKTLACVEACNKDGQKAMFFGDLSKDHALMKMIRENRALQRKPHLGTRPHVFYIV